MRSGTTTWLQLRDAAQAAGLRVLRLRAQEVGGYFWVREGFDLSDRRRDASALPDQMAQRARLLTAVDSRAYDLDSWLTTP